MTHFSERLIAAIRQKQSPSIVGLDPRIDSMPEFVFAGRPTLREEIASFHRLLIDAVNDLVPGVKPQTAFFEQYGIEGMLALADTIAYARERGLLTIVDAKRNDIGSTAEAYARAYLVEGPFAGDALTVSPYLGRDSLLPFTQACEDHGKGLFVLVKTSNPGSGDLQDRDTGGEPVYLRVAEMVAALGECTVGSSGYSSIGAVVGATYPEQAARIRKAMPRAIFLVPGFGAQGATGKDVAPCFQNGLGAVVNSSRGITYDLKDRTISPDAYRVLVRERVTKMNEEIRRSV